MTVGEHNFWFLAITLLGAGGLLGLTVLIYYLVEVL